MGQTGPSAADPYVSTAQVAEALGVGTSTVKRWVDQGILPAHKTAGGHRKLLLLDVLRVVREGDFPRADLSRLGKTTARGSTDTGALCSAVYSALKRGDGDEVAARFVSACGAGLPIETLADTVIAPAMRRLGHEWAEGRLNVWQEHRGTQLCASALNELRATFQLAGGKGAPLAIGGGPEGDPYLLANLLIELALTAQGWRVVNLGPNTPLPSFCDALRHLRPRLLWLSASYINEPSSFLKQYGVLYQTASRMGTAVAIGGQAFTEAFRSRMPYTAFGDGMSQMVAFARSVHTNPRRPKRGRPIAGNAGESL